MFFSPVKYDEPLFRPPSEAYSLIFQVTVGCSWNQCAFCEMYTSKKFRVKPMNEIEDEIKSAENHFQDVRKIFLADGNAMVLSTDKLLNILHMINDAFPKANRISAYASAKDLENKSVEELQKLKEARLKLIYVGIESGDDELLKRINKGETFESTVRNLQKVKAAGVKSSVMILTGLGGKVFSEQHAINSARVVNEIQPEYLSTLVLSFPFGVEHYKNRFDGEFIEMDTIDLLKEQHKFITHTNLNSLVFRSDHASNYLALKGILGRDKERFLKQLQYAINNPGKAMLREEWQRGL
ncbi:MAG: B12-binding domain-containing radical SAM protein [Bacteroidales bacterium]|nr:B12-binding domain-containing radical SAM protein [Bacteroidales bacterium]